MTESISIETIGGHIIALMGGKRVLIDTGAPNSISDSGYLEILGERHVFGGGFSGLTMSQLNDYLNTPINALLGGDTLGAFYFSLDTRAGIMELSTEPIPFEGTEVPVTPFMNIPMIDIEIKGRKGRAFLDTGAKLSFVRRETVSGSPVLGTAMDFYPGFGSFMTNLYSCPLVVAGFHREMTFGNLPDVLEETLIMANVEAIIGTEILDCFRICFNLPRQKLILKAW